MALQPEERSRERREAFQQLLQDELELLAEARRFQLEIDQVLRENRDMLGASRSEAAHPSDGR
jgi:hypothetical protein